MLVPLDRQETVARARHGHERAEVWGVRVVAGDAVVPRACAALGVPIPAHPAVGTVRVSPRLRAMALRAEADRFRQRDRPSVGKPELTSVCRMVTSRTRNVAVLHAEASMRALNPTSRARQGRARVGELVACRAWDDRRLPVCIKRPDRQTPERGRYFDLGRTGDGISIATGARRRGRDRTGLARRQRHDSQDSNQRVMHITGHVLA